MCDISVVVVKIFKIQKFSMHDGPGLRTTVFFYGCPLVCPWCHNPESHVNSNQTLAGFPVQTLSIDGLFELIEKDRLLYDESGGGVTFSGGEPLMQEKNLKKLLQKCRDRMIHSTVDTSGIGGMHSVDTLTLADLVLYDIKALDEGALFRETGAEAKEVNKTLEGLVDNKQRIWLRMPLIPGYGLLNESVADIKAWLEPRKNWFDRINLLPFHKTARNKYEKLGIKSSIYDGPEIDEKIVMAFLEFLKNIHHDVRIGG